VSDVRVDRGHLFAGLGGKSTARIILGGRFGEESFATSWRRLDRFVEAGGRVVDTAHCYADGRSEEVIGAWMRANPGALVVVDKVGHPDQDGAVDLSPNALRRELAESLSRLGVSAIDVVLLHRDSAAVPVEEVASTLAGFVSDGLALRVGVSNWPADRLGQITRALD
jgi:aryl-alcohol dehydrogenase-like predicted oxidoreductase